MDYIEAFKNLKTNNKYSRKSPHKAILLLTVIEMYETNTLSENMILFDEELKRTFLKVWERTLKDEPLFHPEVYLPFWYMQSEDFWHIVPIRGKEDILTLLRDSHVKPSEAKLIDCVKYAELDEDLYFLMTLPSGRSSLKRALLESYFDLTKEQIDSLSESVDNTIDHSVSALFDYEKILSEKGDEANVEKKGIAESDNKLVSLFKTLNEDLQIVLNIQYYSFLKTHRREREMFKEICPSVYELLNKIINHPINQGEILPSLAFTYENFLSDLRISLMGEEGSIDLIDKIENAIDVLNGNDKSEESIEHIVETTKDNIDDEKVIEAPVNKQNDSTDEHEINQVYLDSNSNVLYKTTSNPEANEVSEHNTESRKGKSWTNDEEKQIEELYKQGKDYQTIASIIGRTEIAIKSRLAKLGLIDYTYKQEETEQKSVNATPEKVEESDFTIENSFSRCAILDRQGERVFSAEGKLKYLHGKLYRLNLKVECFTMKRMYFDGTKWQRGEKKIVAYSNTKLYKVLIRFLDYSEVVEEIDDNNTFENCRLKVGGRWYKYNGELFEDAPSQEITENNRQEQKSDKPRVEDSPLYAVRKQAIIRAMGFFRIPADIKHLTKTISRTAWGATIKESDVKEIADTMSELKCVDGKYILKERG